jgi:isopentenyl diphosphate isomerase/L-lactate dehydrogenase-like FMN-dependent dehydrogenase
VDRVISIDEMRLHARRRLPRAVFDAIDGGAGDELTMRDNRDAFRRIRLRPRALADVSQRDVSTTVLGVPISMPLMLAPCGMARMADSGAEISAAKAAVRAGTIFAVSGAASYSLEEVASVGPNALWYQLYLPPNRADAEQLVGAAARANYRVLCVTVDSPVAPKRERDFRNGLTIPLRVSAKMLLAGVSKPGWTRDFLFGRLGRSDEFGFYRSWSGYQRLATTISGFMPVTMDDIHWLRDRWHGKLVVKGVQRGDECRALTDAGVDGLVVSNHGGRNLDGARASIDVLPEVVAAADGRAEVFVDGGIRRGADVLKALALGARACLVGRPYMYGLAAAGESGVDQVLRIFSNEIDNAAALLGCSRIQDLEASFIDVETRTEPLRHSG